MDIGSAFPSKYLKASDLKGNRITVQILGLEMEDIQGEKEAKPILYFANKSKGLVLNKTNSIMIIDIIGSSETDDWMGQRITLFSTRVDFKGRIVDAIRVDKPSPPSRIKDKRPAPEPEPEQESEGEPGVDYEDDAPF